jgi:hypothetical protein
MPVVCRLLGSFRMKHEGFEEVATGVAARYGPGAYPEFVHLSHDHWLQALKRISEARG